MFASGRCTIRVHYRGNRNRERGMGATIILFTIALIVLVGAALAYASRGNPNAANVQGGKVYASVLLKQSADYHDAYSRYIFDGGNAATMTFNGAITANELFNPATQYGSYQAPPPQSVIPPAVATWGYKNMARVPGVGSGGSGSLIYVLNVTPEACIETNQQLYGTRTIPPSTSGTAAELAGASPLVLDVTLNGRATGCYSNGGTNIFYVTLNEG